jgi:peptidoglycan/xylan/chitin deacetylase (PgdA/CDA1 family)
LVLVVTPLLVATTEAKAATAPVTVSLTFDDNAVSQYTLGYVNALLPHNVPATFYVNSGIVGSSSSKLTWSDLSTMAAQGDEVGGKTVDGFNLTTLASASATAEVCNDRQALISHGFTDPISFSYPFGASNASIQGMVAGCGYGSARTAGSLSPSGSRYSGPNPPDNYYAIRAWAPSSQITLAQLESIVTNAYNNPNQGGWTPIVIQRVCDQALDPTNYASCQVGSWIQLSDLNAFLTWVQNKGQPNGAPAGTSFKTVGSVLRASDVTPPVTSIMCADSPCVTTPYSGGSVSVSFSSTDAGSGVASTHYTLDGSNPTLASPTYTGPFTLFAGTTTVNFRSWDNVGNVEVTKSQTIQVAPIPDTIPPTTTIWCNSAPCSSSNYTGGVTVSFTAADNPGGSGVAGTFYTTDGSDPATSTTAKLYTAPFMLASNTTVSYYSVDEAGNAEAVNTQQLSMTPYPVAVTLTFDDQYENQFLYLRPLLLNYNMRATFYVITGDTDAGYACCMSWSQIDTLAADGNDIGGHGVNHLNLTDPSLTYAQKVADVCGSYSDLVNNGISNPVAYAYPFGAYDSTAESIVQSCGFHSARAGGGISSSNFTPSPPYVSPIPPHNAYAVPTIVVDGNNPPQLSDLENFVVAAAINGGGWLPMNFHQVCDAAASDYSTCMGQYGIQDTVLGQFMAWLSNAGQPGGAPGGMSVKTVAQMVP